MSKYSVEEHLNHLRANVPGFMREEMGRVLAEQVAAKAAAEEKQGIVREGNTRITNAAIDRMIEAQNVHLRMTISLVLAVLNKETRDGPIGKNKKVRSKKDGV